MTLNHYASILLGGLTPSEASSQHRNLDARLATLRSFTSLPSLGCRFRGTRFRSRAASNLIRLLVRGKQLRRIGRMTLRGTAKVEFTATSTDSYVQILPSSHPQRKLI